MAQQTLFQQISPQQLDKICGVSLSPTEYQACLNKGHLIAPDVGQLWTEREIEAGLYIIVSGKVRLLNAEDETIEVLVAGQYFGEYTLCPHLDRRRYIARAGIDVQICCLPQAALQPLVAKYPAIQQQLQTVATTRCGAKSGANGTEPEVATNPGSESLELPVDRVSVRAATPTSQKISKAYFPNPTQRVGQLWQRVLRRYPYAAQQSSSDCGAACLAMISRYWGKKFSINRLRDIARVDRNGSSLKGLSAAAESVGFTTRPIKASLKGLAEQPLPAIAHWEGVHYVVVYAIDDKSVIIADPAIGN